MAWVIQENSLGWQPIETRETTAKHPLGTMVRAKDPTYGSAVFTYQRGVASVAAKDWVHIKHDAGNVLRTGANTIGPLGIAMAATTASYYGWFQRTGQALGKCLTQFASGAAVFLTSTASAMDDTSVAGDFVTNAQGASTTAVSSGYAEFAIDWPFTDDRVANT